jgi:hypothetical protein
MKTINLFSDNFNKELGEMVGLPEVMHDEFADTFEKTFIEKLQEHCSLPTERGTIVQTCTPTGKNYFYEDWKKKTQS